MPSTTSSSVSSALASSTVMTPSLPTFCIAPAIILPIDASPFAEMVPTWATSAEEPTFLARRSMSLTAALTAMSTPRSMRSRASEENFTSLAAMEWSPGSQVMMLLREASGDDAHDVGFFHDQEFLTVELDFGARPLAEQHAVATLDVDRDQLAALIAAARADGDDLAFLRLLLGGVGNDDAAGGLGFGI